MTEVTGDFREPRQIEWQGGMLCCRLIGPTGAVLAEQTLPAPDRVCVALDPNATPGEVQPARLTATGPAVFQVRFPLRDDATRLEVYRLLDSPRPADDAVPPGQLVASIPLPAP